MLSMVVVVSSPVVVPVSNPILPETHDDHFGVRRPFARPVGSLGAPRSTAPTPRPGTPTKIAVIAGRPPELEPARTEAIAVPTETK